MYLWRMRFICGVNSRRKSCVVLCVDGHTYVSYNFRLVMSLLVMSLFVLHQQKGWGRGGGRVSTLGQDSMAAYGLSYRKRLISTGWAISLLL